MENKSKLLGVLVFTLVMISSTQAQTAKGTHLTGIQVGNIILSQRENIGNAVQLKPTYGHFIIDKLAVGLAIPIYYFSGGIPKNSLKVTQIGLTPFMRYYIGSGNIKPFLGLAGGIQKTKGEGGGSPTSVDYTWVYSAGGGVAFFINKSISFDIAANYTGTGSKNYYALDGYAQNGLTTGAVNAININLGFQLYLGIK